MACILRVSGVSLDVDALLSTVSLKAYLCWRAGTPRDATKRIHVSSGANFLVSDADFEAFEKQASEALEFVESNLASVTKLANFPGVDWATLDFGVAVPKDAFGSFCLSPRLIRLTAQAGLGIEVSGYPCEG